MPQTVRRFVSDTRLSGKISDRLDNVQPSLSGEDSGTEILGFLRGGGQAFKDMKLNDYITLLFDADGNVAAAYPKKDVSAEMQGIVTKIGGEKATVNADKRSDAARYFNRQGRKNRM